MEQRTTTKDMPTTQQELVIFVGIVSTMIFTTIIPSEDLRTGDISSAFAEDLQHVYPGLNIPYNLVVGHSCNAFPCPPALLTMQINGNPTPPWVLIAGQPFTVTGFLGIGACCPGGVVVYNPTAGAPIVFSSSFVKQSSTTSSDGTYTIRLTAPGQGSYKVSVISALPVAPNGFAGGILNVKPCTSEHCTSSKIATER
ncbi:MAG: hypothetical protein WCA39_10205 [Nitrososphaeraceae archaeon]